MNEQYHIIVAGDQCSPRSFQISFKSMVISASITLIVALALVANSFFTAGLYIHNRVLAKKMDSIDFRMTEIQTRNNNFQKTLQETVAKKEQELNELRTRKDLIISRMEVESSKRIAELEKENLLQAASFKQERELLLSTAISELNERSEFIETVISDIGIKIDPKKTKTPQKNSGGPFVAADEAVYDTLLYRADTYLKTLQTLPLGKPVSGPVSSWYGKREDPINGKDAFHSGIDFRGEKGDPVIATADGKIIFAGKNGAYGKFIKIDHGNGYVTSFGHLDNYHVKKGDHVSRGQVIGLIGNSGRTTGAHLHYEIIFKNKYVNPSKFMKVANLSCSFTPPAEK